MPELPEVETIVRGLRAGLIGETISESHVRWPRIIEAPDPDAFASRLVGTSISSVTRRGKYILIGLSAGWLVVHLRMTGRLLLKQAADRELERDTHVHAVLRLESGSVLYYRDVRKFGRLWVVDDPEALLSDLGPEPLSVGFTQDTFGSMLAGRKRQLKPALLDQRFLAGLGNIYVDESLWRARLHPLRRTHTLGRSEVERLHAAITGVLSEALAHRGTTLRDYRASNGDEGSHQFALAAYGREDEPCMRCGRKIERIVVGQRGTHFCPACQVAPQHIAPHAVAPDKEATDGCIAEPRVDTLSSS